MGHDSDLLPCLVECCILQLRMYDTYTSHYGCRCAFTIASHLQGGPMIVKYRTLSKR
jgi:hypothetical protein